jgi:hypothetical protein
MSKNQNRRSPRKWTVVALIALTAIGASWALFFDSGSLEAQSDRPVTRSLLNRGVFTTAHTSAGQAIQHFFGIRPEPEQPIAYNHRPHIEVAELECNFCHTGVDTGPDAGIPGVNTCMMCHEFIATDKPVIQEVIAYRDRGEDIPWQRVYGWTDEAHVKFNHAPHIRAEVQCATCHGDVAQMGVAERAVDHTMGFCVNCHRQEGASNDCLTCHF